MSPAPTSPDVPAATASAGVPEAVEQTLTIEPPPADWPGLLRTPIPLRALRFRAQLGLPTTEGNRPMPIIATGHQPTVGHPGILAKFLAADAAAAACHAAVVHVVADQDTPDLLTLRHPARDEDGSLHAVSVRLTQDPVFTAMALASQEPATVTDTEPPFARVAEALQRHAGELTLAAQAVRANEDMLADLLEPRPTAAASRVQATDVFGELLEAMRTDPERCRAAYNQAATAHPEAHLRGLGDRMGSPELPLWHMAPGQPRLPVFASKLDELPRHELAPKALLFDLINRLAAGDLFIHGTGGAAYSHATKAWFDAWQPFGNEDLSLAPVVTVSATRTLDLGGPVVTPAEAEHAVWRVHHARHTPEMLGDHDAQQTKEQLVEQLRHAAHKSPERAALYTQLTELLQRVRTERADELDTLQREAAEKQARAEEHHIATDRTWPWVVYPRDTIEQLAAEIREAFSA